MITSEKGRWTRFWGGARPRGTLKGGHSCRLQWFQQRLSSAAQRKSEDGRVAELGLRHSTRNRTWGNTHRGFESRPFRQLCGVEPSQECRVEIEEPRWRKNADRGVSEDRVTCESVHDAVKPGLVALVTGLLTEFAALLPVEIGVVAFVQTPGEFFITLARTGTEKDKGSNQDKGEACNEHGETESE